MYGSWDMEWDRKNYLSFKAIFWPFTNSTWRYNHFTHLHKKWQSYDVWFLRHGARQTEFFVIQDCFLPFYPYMDPKKSKLWKNEKIPENIIILKRCNINDSHMIYGSWDMECNWQHFLSFWAVFCPFTPLTTQKTKILHRCTINENYMMYGSWDTEHDAQNFCHFRPFFAVLLQGSN